MLGICRRRVRPVRGACVLTMRFLIDAQLPPALTRFISAHGHDAEHVIDIGQPDIPDRNLWHYAMEHDAILVTKDSDFIDMALVTEHSPAVVWVRVGNTRRQELLRWLEPLIDVIVERVDSGNRLIELR